MIKEKLAKLIKKKREKFGLSGREFAALLDVDPSEVSKIEKGIRNMKIERIEKICKILDIKITIK